MKHVRRLLEDLSRLVEADAAKAPDPLEDPALLRGPRPALLKALDDYSVDVLGAEVYDKKMTPEQVLAWTTRAFKAVGWHEGAKEPPELDYASTLRWKAEIAVDAKHLSAGAKKAIHLKQRRKDQPLHFIIARGVRGEAGPGKPIQATAFTADMTPSGHDNYASFEDAIEDLRRQYGPLERVQAEGLELQKLLLL